MYCKMLGSKLIIFFVQADNVHNRKKECFLILFTKYFISKLHIFNVNVMFFIFFTKILHQIQLFYSLF